MEVSVEMIKQLRDKTGCGVIECKKALAETAGDFKKAEEVLLKRGMEMAIKKSNRETKQGRIETYVHPGNKMAVIVEINCESDFVAQNQDFCQFTKDVALHIAASDPLPNYVTESDVPADKLNSLTDKKTFLKENCLMVQPFVKDPSKTIQDYLNSVIAKIGENIVISRFIRYKVGEVDQRTSI